MSNNLLICINSRDDRVATATGECPGLVFVGMGFGGCYFTWDSTLQKCCICPAGSFACFSWGLNSGSMLDTPEVVLASVGITGVWERKVMGIVLVLFFVIM